MNLTELENAVLTWFAARAGSEALRIQCETAYAISRTHTGPGQITQLGCTLCAPIAQFPTNCVPNAPLISSQCLSHGASIDLWLNAGKISELEIVTLGGDEMPKKEFPFQLVDSL